MSVLAVVVFIALQRVEAGYGILYNPKWGPAVDNRVGWVVMEAPVFFAMLALWLCSPRRTEIAPVVMALLFELHYFQRSFVFPLLIKGKSRMPLAIVVMGIVFNLINAVMQGGWIFYVPAILHIIFPAEGCSAMCRAPITSARYLNGPVLPYSPGRGPEPCSLSGLSPTLLRVPPRPTAAMPVSSARNSRRSG